MRRTAWENLLWHRNQSRNVNWPSTVSRPRKLSLIITSLPPTARKRRQSCQHGCDYSRHGTRSKCRPGDAPGSGGAWRAPVRLLSTGGCVQCFTGTHHSDCYRCHWRHSRKANRRAELGSIRSSKYIGKEPPSPPFFLLVFVVVVGHAATNIICSRGWI